MLLVLGGPLFDTQLDLRVVWNIIDQVEIHGPRDHGRQCHNPDDDDDDSGSPGRDLESHWEANC